MTVSLSFLRAGTLVIPMDGSDQTMALQAAIDAKYAAGGGIIELAAGVIGVSARVYLKAEVILRGQGKRVTTVRALAAFPTSQPVVTLGTGGGPGSGPGGSTPFAFDTRLEDLEIDANNILGSKCVFSNEAQEGSGVVRCLLNNARMYGIDFVAGCANITIIDNEVYTSNLPLTGAAAGSFAQRGINLVEVPGSNLIMRNTVVGLNVDPPARLNWALYTQNTEANIFGIHGERCNVVAVLGADTAGSCIGASTSAGVAPATTIVEAYVDTWFVSGLTKQSATILYSYPPTGYQNADPFMGSIVPRTRIEGTRKVTEGTVTPTGAHARGELCWNTDPSPGENVGWVCVTTGTPGTWEPFGGTGGGGGLTQEQAEDITAAQLAAGTHSGIAFAYNDTSGAISATVSAGGVADGDKGEISVTGGTWTVDAGVISLAKMSNLAADTIIGRANGGGTGVPQALTATQVRTIINVANGATANSTDATLLARANHTGTQAPSTITFAATDRLLGRATAGAGAGEEIILTAAGRALLDDANAAAQLTTLGAAAATHTHAQADVTNLVTDLAAKAPLASPALTGTPTAPTAGAGTNTTQIASTAYVTAAVAAGGGGGGQPLDATLTALAGLDTGLGLLEQTGTDVFTKRALGVGATTSIPTRADADTRYAAAAHTQAPATINFAATDRLLGRSTAGAGTGEEIVCTAAGRALIDDATAAAQLTTLGALGLAGGTLSGGVKVASGSVTGALTSATHSGGVFSTTGNVTLPNEAGFSATLIAGGAHTVGAGGATLALAVGDMLSVVVPAVGTVRAVKVLAADVLTLATS